MKIENIFFFFPKGHLSTNIQKASIYGKQKYKIFLISHNVLG